MPVSKARRERKVLAEPQECRVRLVCLENMVQPVHLARPVSRGLLVLQEQMVSQGRRETKVHADLTVVLVPLDDLGQTDQMG